jgi:hypothetical protein
MQAASTKTYVCCVASEPPLNETAELNQDVREGKLWDFLDAPKVLPIVSCVKTDRTGAQVLKDVPLHDVEPEHGLVQGRSRASQSSYMPQQNQQGLGSSRIFLDWIATHIGEMIAYKSAKTQSASTTPTSRAAAAMLWPDSTSRTTSCLNSSVHLARCPFLIFVPFRY